MREKEAFETEPGMTCVDSLMIIEQFSYFASASSWSSYNVGTIYSRQTLSLSLPSLIISH